MFRCLSKRDRQFRVNGEPVLGTVGVWRVLDERRGGRPGADAGRLYTGEAPDVCGSLDPRRGSGFGSEDMVFLEEEREALKKFKYSWIKSLRAEDRLCGWYLSMTRYNSPEGLT